MQILRDTKNILTKNISFQKILAPAVHKGIFLMEDKTSN